MVNKQQPDKPHGYDVPNAWPFPVYPAKPWTPEQQRKYAEEQLKNMPPSPL